MKSKANRRFQGQPLTDRIRQSEVGFQAKAGGLCSLAHSLLVRVRPARAGGRSGRERQPVNARGPIETEQDFDGVSIPRALPLSWPVDDTGESHPGRGANGTPA